MTNYERIKKMTVEEMAEVLANEIDHGDCCTCPLDCHKFTSDVFNDYIDGCKEAYKEWLESEVKENEL